MFFVFIGLFFTFFGCPVEHSGRKLEEIKPKRSRTSLSTPEPQIFTRKPKKSPEKKLGEKTTGKSQSITIENASTLSEDEIDKIIKDAEQNAKDDEKRRANIELKNNAETICYTAEKKLNEENSNISESEKESINNIISEIRDLIKKEDFDSLEQKMKELEQLMSSTQTAQTSTYNPDAE